MKVEEIERLDEKIITTKHRRTPSVMSLIMRRQLQDIGCTILDAHSDGQGFQHFVYMTPKKKIRACDFYSTTGDNRNKTRIKDRPANAAEKQRYAVKP